MKNDADGEPASEYECGMTRQDIANWVRDAIARSGKSAAEVARQLAPYGLSLTRSAMSNLTSGERQLSALEMLAISEITGAPIPGYGAPNPDRLSPETFLEFFSALVSQSGLSQAESARFAAAVQASLRKTEGLRGSPDYARSLQDQVETLGLLLFPKQPPGK